MKANRLYSAVLLTLLGWGAVSLPTQAAPFTQCPGDTNQDVIPDVADPDHPDAKCYHLSGGDGFISMADDRATPIYIFGFSDVTGVAIGDVMTTGELAANFSAPTMFFKEGQEGYVNLTNVRTQMRPDLADPHTVHYHGFPQAGYVYDGVPEASISIGEGSTLTYYYKNLEPGTYMYHCHVEAAEHMQMGMLGNLYVHAAQDETAPGAMIGSFTHQAGYRYVYNDGDGSTKYDVEYPIQIGSMDSNFHDLHLAVQPLPFAEMFDTFPMLNGRGYPDTVDPATTTFRHPQDPDTLEPLNNDITSQPLPTLIEGTVGQQILLRISDLNVTRFYTLQSTIPMRVVGTGARQLKGPTGQDLTYRSNSVTLGGGEANDVILDTAGLPAGTYVLYTTNLNYLSNNTEDFGGMMTEIRLTP